MNAPARYSDDYPVDEDCDGWRVLGWRLPSGSLWHGDYDIVDADLAVFDRLPVPEAIPRTLLRHLRGWYDVAAEMTGRTYRRIIRSR